MRNRIKVSAVLAIVMIVASVGGSLFWEILPTDNLSWQPVSATFVALMLLLAADYFFLRERLNTLERIGLVVLGAGGLQVIRWVVKTKGWLPAGSIVLTFTFLCAVLYGTASLIEAIYAGRAIRLPARRNPFRRRPRSAGLT